MSAAARSIIIAIIGLVVAIFLGSQIGKSSWMLPVVIAGGCIGIFIYLGLFRTVRLEGLILAFLMFGYIVGNRGFAQLSIKQGSPLYIGEVGMLSCVMLVAIRSALTRARLIPRIPLASAILVLLIIGGIRLYFDTVLIRSSSLATDAIRDSAAVYYAIFFFIAYQAGQNLTGRRLVERTVLLAFALLIPVAAVEIWAPGFIDRFTFRGYPLISHKGDLLTTFLSIGAFYFFLTPSRGAAKIFYRVCSLTSLILMLFPMSRAALFGFVFATALLLLAGRPQFILYQIGVAVLAMGAIILLEVANVHVESELFGKLTDRVTSITDFSGKGHYQAQLGDASAANNQFRTVWWKTVFNETMDKNAWFGLGFGYDLSASFVRTYYSNQQALWDTRSPHSIWMTILGRMGIIGATCFSIVIFLVLRGAFRAARSVAHKQAEPASLRNWCAVVNLLCSAMFGVVLEGPMGGILFWTFLGLAVSQSSAVKEPEKGLPKLPPQRALEPALAQTALASRRRPA